MMIIGNLILQNLQMPSEPISFVVGAVLIIFAWIVFRWFVRIVLSMVWPIIYLSIFLVCMIFNYNLKTSFKLVYYSIQALLPHLQKYNWEDFLLRYYETSRIIMRSMFNIMQICVTKGSEYFSSAVK